MNYDQLHRLSDLKYQQSQLKLARIFQREQHLRAELEKLRGFIAETRCLPPEHAQMRAVGADVIWMRWVTTSQARLNIELAQVLAQKEGHMVQHKRAFGKAQAALSLAETEKERVAKARRDQALAQAIDLSLSK